MIKITSEEYLDYLYSAGEATDTLEAAYSAAYVYIRSKYGRHTEILLPALSQKDREEFETWFIEASDD